MPILYKNADICHAGSETFKQSICYTRKNTLLFLSFTVMHKALCLLWLALLLHATASGQTPYILNGDAVQRTCNCYILTPAAEFKSGTVWNKNKINLHQSFDYVFDVNLGCKTTGADGIGFILQTKGTNLGASGQGIGFKGISPSLGIIIDTYQNFDENDPPYDHLAIQVNGITDHARPENLTGTVQVLPNVSNIKDCQWHIFRIKWDATQQLLEVSVDGYLRLTAHKDLVNDIFGNDPMVYWGFAGSTGGEINQQQFCAALRPKLQFNNQQLFCEGSPIVFGDGSESFGTVTRWFWDFDDGSTYTQAQPPPHLFPPGQYQVKLVIEDNSGCISDTLNQQVNVDTYPVADFNADLLCIGRTIQLKDASTITTGNVKHWAWDLGNGSTASVQNPQTVYDNANNYTVNLTVTTPGGCSNSTSKTLPAYPVPSVEAHAENVCLGFPINFTGINLTPQINIHNWLWKLDDQVTTATQNPVYTYPKGGTYHTRLYAVSDQGCASDSVYADAGVLDLQLNAGRDTLIAVMQPLQLESKANGATQYLWEPATGLNNSHIPNPVAILQKDQLYQLTVKSPEGCTAIDSVMVKVYKGPEFYVPTAFSPNGDGTNDLFRAIAAGIPQLDYFRVWNRWGQEIFYTTSLAKSWDGTYKGIPQPVDTYIWVISGKDYTGKQHVQKGTLTLIR
jgi:gliding motility-associated-like protein